MDNKRSIRREDSFNQREIAEGIDSYYGDIIPLETENPLTRSEIEKDFEEFLLKNSDLILEYLVNKQTGSFDEMITHVDNPIEHLKKLGITNSDLAKFNTGYRMVDNPAVENIQGDKILVYDYENYDGTISSQYCWDLPKSLLIFILYAKQNISQKNVKGENNQNSMRFYLNSRETFIYENDLFMKVWDEELEKLVNGDAQNITPLRELLERRFETILSNLNSLHYHTRDYRALESQEEKKNYLANIFSNKRNAEILFSAVNPKKLNEHLHFNFDKFAKKYGFISDDPVSDFLNFSINSEVLQDFVRIPTEAEKNGATINYLISDFYRKPFLLREEMSPQQIETIRQDIISDVAQGIKNLLGSRVIYAQNEDERNYLSQFKVNNPAELCDFYLKNGFERSQEILGNHRKSAQEAITAVNLLEIIGYDTLQMDLDTLKKQIREVTKISNSGLWRYLLKKVEAEKDLTEDSINNLEYQSFETRIQKLTYDDRVKLFSKAKKIYWLAQQTWFSTPKTEPFRNQANFTNWRFFDIDFSKTPKHKISENLQKYGGYIDIIYKFLTANNSRRVDSEINFTIWDIFSAIEKEADLRLILVANNINDFVLNSISGTKKFDIENITDTWEEEIKSLTSQEEIQFFLNNSDLFLKMGLNFYDYCKWLSTASEDVKKFYSEFPVSESTLLFKICLYKQQEQVRSWYLELSQMVGGEFFFNYFIKFNSFFSESEVVNLHDSLYWLRNLSELEPGEAKAVLASINSQDENIQLSHYLNRYTKSLDRLRTPENEIRSLRELIKRVQAIESGVEISEFPENIRDILDAPGLNLGQLKRDYATPEFQRLHSGELDKYQPFTPYKKVYCAEPLNSILREALGERSKGIKGKAQNPKELFSILNNLIKGRQFKGEPMTVKDLFEKIPNDLEEDIIEILQQQNMDLGPLFSAELHAKSDPQGWVCGNYTDCCMPYGAYNNNDYMYNLATQYFTVKYNGRIIAQSVVINAIDTRDRSKVIILDNIEVAHNFKKLNPYLSNVYKKFWSEYTALPVKIGTGYLDLVPEASTLESNFYTPVERIRSTDSSGSNIYNLPKVSGIESIDNVITYSNLTDGSEGIIEGMEKESYPEEMRLGRSRVSEILSSQRQLDLPGAATSFIVKKGKKNAGYLLFLPEESEVVSGERVAHIYDMVVLPEFQGTNVAYKMMERIFEVANSYDYNIEAEARESTSYALLNNDRVRRWIEKKGFKVIVCKKLENYLGNENFYLIRFEKIK